MTPSGILWGGSSPGGSYWEISDFSQNGGYGSGRIIHTSMNGGSSVVCALRMWVSPDGWVDWYDRTAVGNTAANDTLTNVTQAAGLPPIATANDAVLTTRIPSLASGPGGLLVVKDAINHKVALYRMKDTTLTAIGTLAAQWTTTKDTGSKVNVYAESGYIEVQNKSGGSLNLAAAFYWASRRFGGPMNGRSTAKWNRMATVNAAAATSCRCGQPLAPAE